MKQLIKVIACHDADRGIGLHQSIPWSFKEDMQHFRELTTGHVVVMGRKTFDTIGRPLPNRTNIVISQQNLDKLPAGVIKTNSLRGALALASHAKDQHVWVIGGGQIYAAALPYAHELHLTQVEGWFGCDTVFPPTSIADWCLSDLRTQEAEDRTSGRQYHLNFQTYTRRNEYFSHEPL